MARYSHKGHDTIRYDTIRKCFTVCKNRKQAGNSAQHWSTVVLPINTVAAAGAWILAVWRRDEATVGGRPVFLEVQGNSAGLL